MKTSESGDLHFSGDFENGPRKNARVKSKNDLKRLHEFKIHKSWPWYSRERLVEVYGHHFVKADMHFFLTLSSAMLHRHSDAIPIIGHGTTYHTCKLTSAHFMG